MKEEKDFIYNTFVLIKKAYDFDLNFDSKDVKYKITKQDYRDLLFLYKKSYLVLRWDIFIESCKIYSILNRKNIITSAFAVIEAIKNNKK